MTLFHEYDSDLERNVDVAFLECCIDTTREFNDYIYKSNILAINESVTMEAEDGSVNGNKGFTNTIKKICDRVMKFFQDVFEMFENMFSSKEHLDTAAYLTSEKGTVDLAYDLEMVQKNVDDEVRKGRKIIQLISKASKVDDKIVEDYVDGATHIIKKNGTSVVKTAVAYSKFCSGRKKLMETKKQMSDASNDVQKCAGDRDKETAAMRIFNSMTGTVNEGLHIFSMYGATLNREAKRKNKNKK